MTQREFYRAFEKYRPAIFKIANSLWASPVDAEEAVSRVRAKFLQRVREIENHGFLSLWRNALQNDAISYLRKRKREVDLAQAAEVQADATALVDAGYTPMVLFALASLTEVERFVVLSHVQHGISLRKIGEALQISRTTVANIYKLARAKLVFELREYAQTYYHWMLTPQDISDAVEWASRVLQEFSNDAPYNPSNITG